MHFIISNLLSLILVLSFNLHANKDNQIFRTLSNTCEPAKPDPKMDQISLDICMHSESLMYEMERRDEIEFNNRYISTSDGLIDVKDPKNYWWVEQKIMHCADELFYSLPPALKNSLLGRERQQQIITKSQSDYVNSLTSEKLVNEYENHTGFRSYAGLNERLNNFINKS